MKRVLIIILLHLSLFFIVFAYQAQAEEEWTIDRFKDLTYARVSGDSMQGAGLENGDLLIIDRSIEPSNNKIAVCFVDGEFTVKRIKIESKKVHLIPENKKYSPIEINEENELIIWGIVTYVIKKL